MTDDLSTKQVCFSLRAVSEAVAIEEIPLQNDLRHRRAGSRTQNRHKCTCLSGIIQPGRWWRSNGRASQPCWALFLPIIDTPFVRSHPTRKLLLPVVRIIQILFVTKLWPYRPIEVRNELAWRSPCTESRLRCQAIPAVEEILSYLRSALSVRHLRQSSDLQ